MLSLSSSGSSSGRQVWWVAILNIWSPTDEQSVWTFKQYMRGQNCWYPWWIWSKKAVKINRHCSSFWTLIKKIHKNVTFHWKIRIKMGGNIIVIYFSLIHIGHTVPFYEILFETSICQFNSSKCSPIMPDEVREHLTRDQRPFLHPESLQIFQIHISMTELLLFSSPHSFSTGFRSEDWNGHSRSLV